MEDEDYGPYLHDIHDLGRLKGGSFYVRERVRRAVNRAAREARIEALAEAQRVLDGYHPERDADFVVVVPDNQYTRKSGPKPDEETKRAQNREPCASLPGSRPGASRAGRANCRRGHDAGGVSRARTAGGRSRSLSHDPHCDHGRRF